MSHLQSKIKGGDGPKEMEPSPLPWTLAGTFLVGLYGGFGLAALGVAASRANYEPNINHPGYSCADMRDLLLQATEAGEPESGPTLVRE